ncbi:RNA polymerase III subunit C82 [Coelomomyces lativittatus]|nr:RNA polymerase III subunit C82 [Coelomomyces lativittatus]KAJ1516621.1 RNA polymerase III subunit C82 [Coelomomyces lativittatus]
MDHRTQLVKEILLPSFGNVVTGRLLIFHLLLHGRLTWKHLETYLTQTHALSLSTWQHTWMELIEQGYVVPSSSPLCSLDVKLKEEKEPTLLDKPQKKGLRNVCMDSPNVDIISRACGLKRKNMDSSFSDLQPIKLSKSFDIDPTIYFSVNFHAFHRYFYHELLVDLASWKINPSASLLLSKVLELHRKASYSVSIDGTMAWDPSPKFSLQQILTHLEPPSPFTSTSTSTPSLPSFETPWSSSMEPPSASSSLTHVTALTPTLLEWLVHGQFLSYDPRTARYTVPLNPTLWFTRHLISTYLQTQWGTTPVRLFNAVLQLGYMEETHLSTVCMLPVSVTRAWCMQLHTLGVMDLHMVPKTIDRAPARSWFLLGSDLRRVHREWIRQSIWGLVGALRHQRTASSSSSSSSSALASFVRPWAALVQRMDVELIGLTVFDEQVAEMKVWRGSHGQC